MSILSVLRKIIPEPIRHLILLIMNLFINKYDSELSFWRKILEKEKGRFPNNQYKQFMLAMADESSDNFLKGKIVADFGCGPQGSLVWARSALLRIGIDVLADRYADEFTDNIISHGMIYLKSTEHVIPLPSNFVDVIFTNNAMDHVVNFSEMCREIIRVLKPGGEFIGGFNLEEPATPSEPQQLNVGIINEFLLDKLELRSYHISKYGGDGHVNLFDENSPYTPGQKGYLLVKAWRKIN